MAARARNPLLDAHQFFRRGPVAAEGWRLVARDRRSESFYRDRWHHDKVAAPPTESTAPAPARGMSTRTAEAHLQHIRTKLGFRSRAQVAAWVVSVGRNANGVPEAG